MLGGSYLRGSMFGGRRGSFVTGPVRGFEGVLVEGRPVAVGVASGMAVGVGWAGGVSIGVLVSFGGALLTVSAGFEGAVVAGPVLVSLRGALPFGPVSAGFEGAVVAGPASVPCGGVLPAVSVGFDGAFTAGPVAGELRAACCDFRHSWYR